MYIDMCVCVCVCVCVCESESESHSVMPVSATLWTTQSMEFSRPEYWSGKPFPSPGDLPTEGLNPGLLHYRQILYQLSHKGSQRILEWIAYPLSSGSIPPRKWICVSCIAGGFFTNWAVMEAYRKMVLMNLFAGQEQRYRHREQTSEHRVGRKVWGKLRE